MFLEVPSIKSIKKTDIFKIIKTKIDKKGLEYYPITDELIYVVEDKDFNDLLSAKLIKNVIKNNIEDFIVTAVTKIKEEGEIKDKLLIFTRHKGNISSNLFPVEKSSLLSVIMSNINQKDIQLFYIANKILDKIIEETIKLSGFKEENVVETNGELVSEDYKLLVKDSMAGFSDDIDKYKEQIKKLFKITEKKEAIKNSSVKRNSKNKRFIVPTVIVVLLGGSIFGGFQYYVMKENEKIAIEKAKAEAEARSKAEAAKPKKINTVKVKSNLLKGEMVKYIINSNGLSMLRYTNGSMNLILNKEEFLKNEELMKLKNDDRYLSGNNVYLQNVDYKQFKKEFKMLLTPEQNQIEISTDYLLLSNEFHGLYKENKNKEYVLRLNLKKHDFLNNIDRIFSNNKDEFDFLITYNKVENIYSINIFKLKGEPAKVEAAVKKPLTDVENPSETQKKMEG